MTAVESAAAALGPRAQRNVPVGPLTTYRVGGAAALFTRIDSEDDLALVAGAVRHSDVAVLIVGNGSNLLVSDEGFDGLVIELGAAFADLAIAGSTVTAGAA